MKLNRSYKRAADALMQAMQNDVLRVRQYRNTDSRSKMMTVWFVDGRKFSVYWCEGFGDRKPTVERIDCKPMYTVTNSVVAAVVLAACARHLWRF